MVFGAFAAIRIRELVLALSSPIRVDPLGNGVAVDAEGIGSIGNALLIADESFLDIKLFEFLEGLIQEDVAVEHILNDGF